MSYLVQSLAFTKWMKSCFNKIVVAGLSQGGAAAMLNALQSKPTVAIVASGHSVINEKAQWSGFGGLVAVPGYAELYHAVTLRKKLQATTTMWLFSWGHGEKGTYKIEAEERCTAKEIGVLANVSIVIHEFGHTFPIMFIQKFIKNHLG